MKLRTSHQLFLFFFLLASHSLQAQRISTAVGTLGNGGQAVNADLTAINAVAVAPNGDVVIGQGTPMVAIRRINPTTGVITHVAGNGTFGTNGLGGPAVDAELYDVQGIAIDATGNIYVTTAFGVRRIDAVSGIITKVAGVDNMPPGFTGDNGPAVDAKLGAPVGLAVDATHLYIADWINYRIRRVNLSTGIITTFAGTGSSIYSGDNGQATAAGMAPRQLTLDGLGNLYFSDDTNHRIRKINIGTGVVTAFAGDGTSGGAGNGGQATAAQISPGGILVDGDNFYIADEGNSMVRKVVISTGIISAFAGTGVAGYSGDSGPATSAQFGTPRHLAKDGSGNLYVTDYIRMNVRKISGGNISTFAGNGGFRGDGGLATEATVHSPHAIAFNTLGDLIVVDSQNRRLRKVDHTTGNISTIAGTGINGIAGDGGAATAANLALPWGLAIDANNNIYFSDVPGARIRRIDAISGNITTIAGTGIYGSNGDGGLATSAQIAPLGIALDGNGNLYVAEQYENKVRKIVLGTGVITTVAGTGSSGFSGDGGQATSAQFNGPIDVAVDANNDLYIADQFNNRIRKVTISTGVITTFKSFSFPLAVKFAPDGSMLVGHGQFVESVNMISGVVSTAAGSGKQGYGGDGGSALSASLYSAYGVAMDAAGNLFISDADTHRVRKVAVQSTQAITFGALPNKTLGDAPFNLTATATSGLTVTFSTSSNKLTLATNQVTLTKAGRATIKADQSGNLTYNVAASVEQSFCINPAKPTISISNATPAHPVLTSSNDAGNQWYLNGNQVAGAVNNTFAVDTEGAYTVKTTVDDCVSEFSASLGVIITGTEESIQERLFLYPNPVGDKLVVIVHSDAELPVSFEVLDLFGKKVITHHGKTNREEVLETRDIASGPFVIQAITDGMTYRQRIMKR